MQVEERKYLWNDRNYMQLPYQRIICKMEDIIIIK